MGGRTIEERVASGKALEALTTSKNIGRYDVEDILLHKGWLYGEIKSAVGKVLSKVTHTKKSEREFTVDLFKLLAAVKTYIADGALISLEKKRRRREIRENPPVQAPAQPKVIYSSGVQQKLPLDKPLGNRTYLVVLDEKLDAFVAIVAETNKVSMDQAICALLKKQISGYYIEDTKSVASKVIL
jgi:hypothetical protein